MVTRLLGALVQARRRKEKLFLADRDPALRLGVDLLDGYRVLIRNLGSPRDEVWIPRQPNGVTPWADPGRAAELRQQARREEWLRLRAEFRESGAV